MKHSPIDHGPQDAPSRTGRGFTFSEEFADPPLDLSGAGGVLEPQKTPDRLGHDGEEGVRRHCHAPMNGQMILDR
jgi:hypothetical protein